MRSIAKTILFTFVVASASVETAEANVSVQAENIGVQKLRVNKNGGDVEVNFRMSLQGLGVKPNNSFLLTPVLVKGDSLCSLPPVMVTGRRRELVNRRNRYDGIMLKYGKDDKAEMDYSAKVEYREWMSGASLMIASDHCGCGGTLLDRDMIPIRMAVLYRPQPVLAFAVPAAEPVKVREESGKAFLDFPVNETVIYPDYRNNRAELEKIRATIDRVKNDANTHITHISIHGYASPEGDFANNGRLAGGRADALKQYVLSQYGFVEDIIDVSSTPEDWRELRRWVEDSQMELRKEVLEIIDLDMEEDAKNYRLRLLNGGKTYSYLLKEVYPSLRRSDYVVRYTVRAFNAEEAKKLLKERPQLLSLEEMYAVSATYAPGSEEFNEVFDIAVRLFPNDETANINAALVAIGEKNYMRAERYLEKAGGSAEAVYARGVLCLMTGRYDEAEALLKQAAEAGIKAAGENLKQLEPARGNR
ncbi:DUF3868 domain-containing protein [Parabacteroides distasonis]|nr:DUF3868 domain-containing protein [Parabacteroides distasonis]MDB8996116.1 DUF3868 domain-containing protein [Parabacteroides distasonis]